MAEGSGRPDITVLLERVVNFDLNKRQVFLERGSVNYDYLVLAVGSVSGAHLNPIVSCVDAAFGGLRRGDLAWYVLAQVAGAATGVLLANLMFGLPAVNISTHVRSSAGLWLGEIIATLGLLLVVFGLVLSKNTGGAVCRRRVYNRRLLLHVFTSFANPAVTLARTLSDTFAVLRRRPCLALLWLRRWCRDRMRRDSRSLPAVEAVAQRWSCGTRR
jgi:hypothetical protein